MIKTVKLNFGDTLTQFDELNKTVIGNGDHYDRLISTIAELNKRSETFNIVIQVNTAPTISSLNSRESFANISIGCLTKRELEVFSLAIKGYSNKLISDTLFISIETVKSHRKSIVRKAGVSKIDDIKNLILKTHKLIE